jgi:hypothetical protein
MSPQASAMVVAWVAVGSVLAGQTAEKQPQSPVSVTIQTKQAEFRAGTPVRLSVIIRNESTHDLQRISPLVARTSGDLQIQVLDAKGNPAPNTALGLAISRGEALYVGSDSESAVGERPLIRPGHSTTEDFLLNDQFDLSQLGKYTAKVQLKDSKTGTVARSNLISFTITQR